MVYLRKATMQDVDIIYNWANDPDVRKASFNSEIIPYETHVKWFERIMASDDVLQYILMDKDMPVAQIRLSTENETAEIGYSVAPEHRGRGYGHAILRLITDEVKKNYPGIKTLEARVKPDNKASQRLFESEGYKTEYYCYTLDTKR